MIDKLRQHPFMLVGTIICLVTGIFLLVADPAIVMIFIYFVVGGGIILSGIYKIIISEIKDKLYFYNGVTDVVVGICYMFFHDIVTAIILGLILMVFPAIRILRSRRKYLQFKTELPHLIFGSVIAISGGVLGEIFVKVLGGTFILLAIYIFINIFTDKLSIFRLSFGKKKSSSYETRYDNRYEEDDNIINVDSDDSDSW